MKIREKLFLYLFDRYSVGMIAGIGGYVLVASNNLLGAFLWFVAVNITDALLINHYRIHCMNQKIKELEANLEKVEK